MNNFINLDAVVLDVVIVNIGVITFSSHIEYDTAVVSQTLRIARSIADDRINGYNRIVEAIRNEEILRCATIISISRNCSDEITLINTC